MTVPSNLTIGGSMRAAKKSFGDEIASALADEVTGGRSSLRTK